MNIIQFCRNEIDLALSPAQEATLRALYGLEMPPELDAVWRELTGREPAPGVIRQLFDGIRRKKKPVDAYTPAQIAELLLVCGRRGGKTTHIAAPVAAYELCCVAHPIPPREKGYYLLLAPVEHQARQLFDNVVALIRSSKTFSDLIPANARIRRSANETEVELSGTNKILRVVAGNPRTIRGGIVIGAVLDEAAWFIDDSGVNNLQDILEALRPSLATVPDGKLLLGTTPRDKSGPVWEMFEKRRDPEHQDVLVIQGSTRLMNPAIPEKFLKDQKRKHGAKYFAREFEAQFDEGIANALLDPKAVDRAVVRSFQEIPPNPKMIYSLGLDPSNVGDPFAYAIAHPSNRGNLITVSLVRAFETAAGRPHDTRKIMGEIASVGSKYGVAFAACDQISFAFVSSEVQETLGIEVTREITGGDKALPLFRKFQELLSAGKILLPDDPRLIGELKRLTERVQGRHTTIEARGHDDRAIACVLAVWTAYKNREAADPVHREVIRTGEPRKRFLTAYGAEPKWKILSPGGHSAGGKMPPSLSGGR